MALNSLTLGRSPFFEESINTERDNKGSLLSKYEVSESVAYASIPLRYLQAHFLWQPILRAMAVKTIWSNEPTTQAHVRKQLFAWHMSPKISWTIKGQKMSRPRADTWPSYLMPYLTKQHAGENNQPGATLIQQVVVCFFWAICDFYKASFLPQWAIFSHLIAAFTCTPKCHTWCHRTSIFQKECWFHVKSFWPVAWFWTHLFLEMGHGGASLVPPGTFYGDEDAGALNGRRTVK